MNIIGRIYTDRKIKGVSDFIEVIDPSLSPIKDDLPYIIVGYKLAANYLGDKLSFLDRKIGDKSFWTFNKYEKREIFESDLNQFINNLIVNIIDEIQYKPIQIYNCSYTNIKNIINNLKTQTNYIYITQKNIYYFNNNLKKEIIGISYNDIDYLGINRKKIYNLLASNKKNIIYSNKIDIPYIFNKLLNNKVFIYPYIIFLLQKAK